MNKQSEQLNDPKVFEGHEGFLPGGKPLAYVDRPHYVKLKLYQKKDDYYMWIEWDHRTVEPARNQYQLMIGELGGTALIGEDEAFGEKFQEPPVKSTVRMKKSLDNYIFTILEETDVNEKKRFRVRVLEKCDNVIEEVKSMSMEKYDTLEQAGNFIDGATFAIGYRRANPN